MGRQADRMQPDGSRPERPSRGERRRGGEGGGEACAAGLAAASPRAETGAGVASVASAAKPPRTGADNRQAVARQLYEHSPMSVAAIAALVGVGRSTLGRWAASGGWQRRRRLPATIGPLCEGGGVPAPADLTDAIASLMDQAIARLRRDLAEGRTDPDRMVRAVAALAHAIQGLRAAEERRQADMAAKPNGGADDGRHADDHAGGGDRPSLTDLHAELCRRLDKAEAAGDAPESDADLDG